ncbi:MAG: DUF268 domain-containing protein, partial [Kiritimatiellales bacterium]
KSLSPRFRKDLSMFKRQMVDGVLQPVPLGKMYPILDDAKAESGIGDKIYFFQDLYIAQEIFKANPARHVDIGSRVDGLIAHVASFREIEIFDIRPLNSKIRNVKFTKCDLMGELSPDLLGCTDSLSCLHAIEHFGLGRYGDPINANGHLAGFENLSKMVKSGGIFYFSVPLGSLRVEFNAHRVFSMDYLLKTVQRNFEIEKFSYVSDKGELHINIPWDGEAAKQNFNCKYGCAIFTLVKRG